MPKIDLYKLADVLNRISAPLRLERELLEILGLYPEGLDSHHRLSTLLSPEYQNSTIEQVHERMMSGPRSPTVLAALRAAADAFGEEEEPE